MINPTYEVLPRPSLDNSSSNLNFTKANNRCVPQANPASEGQGFCEPVNENEYNFGFNPSQASRRTSQDCKSKESAGGAKATGSRNITSTGKKSDQVVVTGGSEKSKPVVSSKSVVRQSFNNSDVIRAKVEAQLKKGAPGSKGNHMLTGVPVLMKP